MENILNKIARIQYFAIGCFFFKITVFISIYNFLVKLIFHIFLHHKKRKIPVSLLKTD